MRHSSPELLLQGVRVLGVGHLVSWTSYFVIATVTSQPQMNAALGRITREARDRFELAPLRTVDGRCVCVRCVALCCRCAAAADAAHAMSAAQRVECSLCGQLLLPAS